MVKAILLSSFCFVVFFVAHTYVFHRFQVKRRFRSLVFIAIGSLCVYAILFVMVPQGFYNRLHEFSHNWHIGFFNGLFLFFFWYYFYFHLIIVIDRSVSTRIMTDIQRFGNKGLTVEEIKNKYSLEDKFRYELSDMDYLGRIKPDGKFYKNTAKGKTHARVMKFLRQYLHMGDKH